MLRNVLIINVSQWNYNKCFAMELYKNASQWKFIKPHPAPPPHQWVLRASGGFSDIEHKNVFLLVLTPSVFFFTNIH